jgi:hypothetical protein
MERTLRQLVRCASTAKDVRKSDGVGHWLEIRAHRSQVSGLQGANFTAGGRENRPREAGDSVLVKTEDHRSQVRAGPVDPTEFKQKLTPKAFARHGGQAEQAKETKSL